MSAGTNLDLESIRAKIVELGSKEARTSGNINENHIDRQLAGAGVARKPEDIPKQDKPNSWGSITPSSATQFIPSTKFTGKSYRLGGAIAPEINHDKGFSDEAKKNARFRRVP